MDQSVVLFIGGLLAVIVAILVLVFALYGFQQSLKETNRRRRDLPANDNQRIQPPDITARSTSPRKIEFGEIIELDSIIEPTISSSPDTNLGKCTLCWVYFTDTNYILCPNCEAKYHEHCFAEYARTCNNCGWRES